MTTDEVPALSDTDGVRAYLKRQANLGLENVIGLVRGERDAIMAQIGDLTEEEGQTNPSADEYSALQVLQHLNGSLDRSRDRLATLSSGRPWTNTGAPATAGGIPADAVSNFVEARRLFREGTDAVLAVLEAADGKTGLDVTVSHAQYGPFNWLEWAAYSHHVHTHDHVGQMAQIRAAVRGK